MTSRYRGTFVLIDERAVKTSLNYIMEIDDVGGLGAEFELAVTAMATLKTSLALITDANFYSETLAHLIAGDSAVPTDADVTDVAQVITYLTGTGVAPKFHTVRVPAPVDGIFNADQVTIDKADVDLIGYIDDLSTLVLVSDDESIVTDIDNGIAGGGWSSVKKNRSAVQSV